MKPFASKNIIVTLLFAASGISPLIGQVLNPSEATIPPTPGVGHNYLQALNETVNPESGSVSLYLGVPVPPGRKLNMPFSFNYDSSGVLFFQSNPTTGIGLIPTSYYSQFALGGWSYGFPRLDTYTRTQSVPFPPGQNGDGSTSCGVTVNYTFVAVDGSYHQLGLSHIYNNGPGQYPNSSYQCQNSEFSEYDTSPTDPIYQAALTALATGASSPFTQPPNDGTPEVAGPDGTLYTFGSLACSANSSAACSRLPVQIEDKDGNILTVMTSYDTINPPSSPSYTTFGFSVQDTLGRTILNGSNFGVDGSTVVVSGLAQPFTTSWTNSSFSGYSINSTLLGNPGQANCPRSGSLGTGSQQQSSIQSITLPNGRSYGFQYDPVYGTLQKVTYPSGGYVRYEYGINANTTLASTGGQSYYNSPPNPPTVEPGACTFMIDTIAVQHRYVSFGQNEVLRQDFTYAPTVWGGAGGGWASKQTTVIDNDLLRGTSSAAIYNYLPIYVYTTPNGLGGNGEVAVESQIIYKDTNGAVLRTVTKGWADQFTLTCEVDTLGASGKSSAVFYTYGPGNVVIDKKEYDYGLVGPSSCYNGATTPAGITPTRDTATTYQAFNASTFTAPSLKAFPCRVTVSSGATVAAETDMYYDGGTTVCGIAGTPSVTSVSSLPTLTHDETNYGGSARTPRADLTRLDRQIGNGAAVTTTMTYDETGQVISSTDPCGNTACNDITGTSHTTTYSYMDRYSAGTPSGSTNAYLTEIIMPSTSGVMHQQNYTYSLADGHLTSAKDENNQVTQYTYNVPQGPCTLPDGLDRLTQVSYPDGGQTIHCYNDAVGSPSIATYELLNGTWKQSVSTMDGVGHTTQTELVSDSGGPDYIHTTYDGKGREWTVSNPTHSSLPSAGPITAFFYDALGRPIETITQDGTSKRSWCYNGTSSSPQVSNCNALLGGVGSGSWIDSTDEAGNHRQAVSDSFGNLTEVMEPSPSAPNVAAFESDYLYDTLNNLRSVTQKGGTTDIPRATRMFGYDSLSRLVTSFNPETGTICYGQQSGTSCSSGYDANGNLSFKTDARGVVTTYTYDPLNRLIQTIIPLMNSAGVIPSRYQSTCYQYDSDSTTATGTNSVGRLVATWTQTGNTCALTSSVLLTSKIISQYDAMGRPLASKQCVLTMCQNVPFIQNETYDFAGNITSWTNGIGLTLNLQYDSAGRPSSLTDSLTGNGQSSVVFSAQSYTPAGALQSWIVGQPNYYLNFVRTYDSRLRVQNEAVTH